MRRLGWWAYAVGSLVVLLALTLVLWWGQRPRSLPSEGTLFIYCAAGLRTPLQQVMEDYSREFHVTFETKFDGSGKLLGELKAGGQGDLFLAGETSYLEDGRKAGLVRETVTFATQRPCLVWRPGATLPPNGDEAAIWASVLRDDMKLSLADPKVAAISRALQRELQGVSIDGQSLWERLQSRAAVVRTTVNEVANDVKSGFVDVGLVWDATAKQYPELQVMRMDTLDRAEQGVGIGVASTAREPARALHFVRYLTARDRGLAVFAKSGYEVTNGDPWNDHPEIRLFTGGLMHPAIQAAVQDFEKREGVRVVMTPNGCGLLVTQIKAGEHPDIYFACDRTFMTPVADVFPHPKDISSTEMVLITRTTGDVSEKVRSLEDVAAGQWRVGICDPKHSALGALSQRLLEKQSLWEKIRSQVVDWPSTADRLVENVVLGAIDAAIVYQANTTRQREHLRVIPLDDPQALAIQPIAVAADSRYPAIAQRLVEQIRSAQSQQRFESLGFHWLGDADR